MELTPSSAPTRVTLMKTNYRETIRRHSHTIMTDAFSNPEYEAGHDDIHLLDKLNDLFEVVYDTDQQGFMSRRELQVSKHMKERQGWK